MAMKDYFSFKTLNSFDVPHAIPRSAYYSVRLNVVAFVIIGFFSLFSGFDQAGKSALADGTVKLFFLLSPIWLAGAHYTARFLALRKPSWSLSFRFSTKLLFRSLLVWFVVYTLFFVNGDFPVLQEILLTALFLLFAFCSFMVLGFINGRFGLIFSVYNLILIAYTLGVGGVVAYFQWFTLFGLIPVESHAAQVVMLTVTVLLGLSEKSLAFLGITD